MSDKEMKIGLSLVSNGTHPAGWRLPDADAAAGMNFALWKEMAQAAERAMIHFIFLADGAAVRTAVSDNEALSYSGRIDQFEPLTLIGALSAVTERIGFIATATTTYNEPFHIARKFASLDHISGGRVGWNVVTSWSDAEARNFGGDRNLEHSKRYNRAEEFIDVVRKLWDSWEDDAFIRDKEEGRYFDPSRMHVPNHIGEHFRVKGPLNVARPPQGYPVIAQAGSSGPGQELAARTADLVYTAKRTAPEAKAFLDEVKGRFEKYGRTKDSALVLPGIMPVIGRTVEEARAKYQRVQDLIHPRVGLTMLAHTFGDLSSYDLDGPLPEDLPVLDGVRSDRDNLIRMARSENLSIRKLYERITGAAGHMQICGTPEMIADEMQSWFEQGACDGFNIMAPWYPGGLYEFLDQVVPILQARGLFRKAYRGRTLRENLGLARPGHGSFVRRTMAG